MIQDKSFGLLSPEQTTAILDNAPVAVYVSALETYELLYANGRAKKILLTVDGKPGDTCYQAVGLDRPCPFCRVSSMNRSELTTRKFRHPGNQRVYQLSGMLIDWNGRAAHIEYIMDITEAQKEDDRNKALKEELVATFSSIPSGLCVYRYEKGRITPIFHNPAFYIIMGYSEKHVKAVEENTNFLGVHPEDLTPLQAKIRKAIQTDGIVQDTYRVWSDAKQEYRWIQLDGSVKSQEDGTKLLYGVYSDVNERRRLERELTDANNKMQDIINAIPGGVAIYKIAAEFEVVYLSDGVSELSGYTPMEYRKLLNENEAELTYGEDVPLVAAKVREAIQNRGVSTYEYRQLHRDGRLVWVRAQVKWIGEADGGSLLHCVFHNITEQKEAQLEMEHMLNSIPGGIASYRVEGGRLIPTFFSDGVLALSGHSREELTETTQQDALGIVHESDRARVQAALETALETGVGMDISYRMRHKDGSLIWIHLNGQRMDPVGEGMRFYAVFTGMSPETRLFQSIANEMADGIYVIDKENYDLLYANETQELFQLRDGGIGQKCYAALHGKESPCDFCTIQNQDLNGITHTMPISGTERCFNTRFRETDWNGIPAYVKYVQDVTEEVKTRREKQRLEEYFQSVVKNLPGGIAVIRYEEDGSMTPEFISDGFAEMTGMTLEDTWRLYRQNAMIGVHPEDRNLVTQKMSDFISSGESHCKITYRLIKGDGSYIWVKNSLSAIQNEGGGRRVYAGYQDITKELEEQEQLRQQYNEQIIQHYRMQTENELVAGHCNISQNRILEIVDLTNSGLLEAFGTERESFFSGVASLVADEEERQDFLNTYLNGPSLAAYERGDTELIRKYFVKLPKDTIGRYVQFKVNLVETPDSGDITGILTVTDITEETISNRILQQLSVASYDLVVDVDLRNDRYQILTESSTGADAPAPAGRHSEQYAYMIHKQVLPKDRARTAKLLDPDYIRKRLQKERSYSFSYAILGEKGDVLTKNLTITASDLRLDRICLARTDITDSVREQQGLLNVIAYTFELLTLINVNADRMTLYTRQAVLENLPPFVVDHYSKSLDRLAAVYNPQGEQEEIAAIKTHFCIEVMLKQLQESPGGYDFVLPYQSKEGLRYKQINVLWGDGDHRTVCMVRADVTDMLSAERQTKDNLEKALKLAEEANRAKSDFLSSMSHDIRTPMNAIMGMTALAAAHLDDRTRVEACLRKIGLSSKHLLSLVNDILDMSKIERSKITLNRMKISLSELIEQLSDMMSPQAKEAGIELHMQSEGIKHWYFYGDALRINQILINILSNAVKFTPERGRVDFRIKEIPPLQDPSHVRFQFCIRDTGIGMSEEFLGHIFEPFTRSRNATRIEGSGLGLSIVKGLVDLMGGKISAESQERRGTTFHIELECMAASADERSGEAKQKDFFAAPNEKNLRGRRFLVAEDNAINAEILCELLQLHGAKAVVRTDGAQAVRAFQTAEPGTYDAILMDIQMPVMNGYEATRAIRKLSREDARSIPILAMTANAFAEDIQAAQEAGMNAHVAKPIDIQLLWSTLGDLMRGAEE